MAGDLLRIVGHIQHPSMKFLIYFNLNDAVGKSTGLVVVYVWVVLVC